MTSLVKGLCTVNLFMIGKTVKETFPGIEQVWIDQFASTVVDKKPLKFTEYNQNIGKHYQAHCYSPAEN